MEKTYLWLVHDYLTHDLHLTDEQVSEMDLPIYSVELKQRYNLFVIARKELDYFLQKIRNIIPCDFKAYQFTENEILVGEHYVDPFRRTRAFIPWLGCNSFILKYQPTGIFSLPMLTPPFL